MSFKEHLEYYRSQHKDPTNVLCHMLGVYSILIALLAAVFSIFTHNTHIVWTNFWIVIFFGWTLQFIGHFFFEKNRPVFFKDLWAFPVAIIFLLQELGVIKND